MSVPTIPSIGRRSHSRIYLCPFNSMSETMRRKPRSTLFFSFALTLILCFAFFSLHLSWKAFFSGDLPFPTTSSDLNSRSRNSNLHVHYAIQEGFEELSHRTRRVSSITDPISTVSLLFPDWEVLLIVSTDAPLSPPDSLRGYVCLFQNNATSPANFSATLAFADRTTFRCLMPESVRRLRPFLQPILTKLLDKDFSTPTPELLRWTFFVYEALSTEDDVVLFAKGVNHRQGTNRSPTKLRCVFGEAAKNNVVRTAVTTSMQEVFRCPHPNLTEIDARREDQQIKITLEIVNENDRKGLLVPSVAYYFPRRRFSSRSNEPKSFLCACTMVYNVGKFLKEWVMYHSKIGVEKFILYDNGSDDELQDVVKALNLEGYKIETVSWIWPKTQEAGFSHSVLYTQSSCTWMMYVDIDEFVFSPSWRNSLQPSKHMLNSLLPRNPPKSYLLKPSSSSSTPPSNSIGQVSIKCNDYGPSNQLSHPPEGVTQGYTCRRRVEQRHKSIVLLEAVDPSLLNVIHHFQLKREFRSKQMSLEEAVVNHYKYQAWPEFRIKFRRRVSAYVVDWKESANLNSKDRAPGLGNADVEPKKWPQKFCEIRDDRLRLLTRRWFGSQTQNGYRMAWQI